jgi:phosphoenolpyruvate carboxykinase (GTP)
VPLIYQSFSWNHGVFTGATLKSKTTAAAEHTGKKLLWDPMAARPFMGYNFGKYLQHWVDLNQPGRKMPAIFNCNWFRKGKDGKFLWPGFGDNIRVIDWIINRLEGKEGSGKETAIGIVPTENSLNLEGLDKVNFEELMSLPRDYWHEDAKSVRKFLEEQVGPDLPDAIRKEMDEQEKRIQTL